MRVRLSNFQCRNRGRKHYLRLSSRALTNNYIASSPVHANSTSKGDLSGLELPPEECGDAGNNSALPHPFWDPLFGDRALTLLRVGYGGRDVLSQPSIRNYLYGSEAFQFRRCGLHGEHKEKRSSYFMNSTKLERRAFLRDCVSDSHVFPAADVSKQCSINTPGPWSEWSAEVRSGSVAINPPYRLAPPRPNTRARTGSPWGMRTRSACSRRLQSGPQKRHEGKENILAHTNAQSSVRGADAIWPARHPFHGTISRTSVGQARTHCVHPMHVS